MSLLLDALKKAADDKQKAEKADLSVDASNSAEAEVTARSIAGLTSDGEVNDVGDNEGLSDTDELKLQGVDETGNENTSEGAIELTLEDVSTDKNINKHTAEAAYDSVAQVSEQATNNNSEKYERPDREKFTVSDDALSLLIYKTNRDVKIGKRITVMSVTLICFIILISGGVFYYLDMQAEIEMMERKHQIAMKVMRSKTSQEKTTGRSELARNLVSDSALEEKIQYGKNVMQEKNHSAQAFSAEASNAGGNAASPRILPAQLSIQKTKTSDPVGEKLDKAWQLYESGRYDEAATIYKNVLVIENDNRDALLGIGAIAVIENNASRAREIYRVLLEQDPRDPIATAALASLHDGDATLVTDEDYLLSMIGKNPDASHLNFALGNNYAQQNKWQSAQKYYFNAWQHDNENADYIFNLAVSMDQLGKQLQAINFYKDCLIKSENKQVSFSRNTVKKRIRELSEL